MDVTGAIESAENHYKQILEDFFISVYDDSSLSSHGIDHHRRVWFYAKELLRVIPLKNTDQLPLLAAGLIIACYLHDIGMSVDRGFKHGLHSKNLCIRFLTQNNLSEKDFPYLLEAIENHDNKDYDAGKFQDELIKILSVSDDLDAFGFIGIYRYSEIYLTRGIGAEKLGYLIVENARKRYNNFVRTAGLLTQTIEKYTERYKILNNFFEHYNDQLPSCHSDSTDPSGYCGVISLFARMIKTKTDFKALFAHPEEYKDPILKWYFTGLKNELKSAEIPN